MYPICDPSWIYAGSAHAYIQSGDTKSLHRKWLKLHYVGYIMWGYKVRLGVCDDISEGRGRGQGVGWLLGLGICNTICNWISPVIICHRWTSTTSLTQKQRKWDKQINPCLVRGIPCLVLGYSVTRPGNMGSPGVVRELSGSIPWLYRD